MVNFMVCMFDCNSKNKKRREENLVSIKCDAHAQKVWEAKLIGKTKSLELSVHLSYIYIYYPLQIAIIIFPTCDILYKTI